MSVTALQNGEKLVFLNLIEHVQSKWHVLIYIKKSGVFLMVHLPCPPTTSTFYLSWRSNRPHYRCGSLCPWIPVFWRYVVIKIMWGKCTFYRPIMYTDLEVHTVHFLINTPRILRLIDHCFINIINLAMQFMSSQSYRWYCILKSKLVSGFKLDNDVRYVKFILNSSPSNLCLNLKFWGTSH